MPKFADGVLKFQSSVFPENESLFEKISHGQSPEALFITCSDSRIATGMLTQTGPDELFVCRNAGNIVPRHDAGETFGVTASIEFALRVLKVPHIVVCGHSGCGAMEGAMNPETLSDLPHVKNWVGHVKPAIAYVQEHGSDKSDAEKMSMLIEQNVVLQMENLKTHPVVALAIETGLVQLHGWVYDIKSGGVTVYDANSGAFAPIG